MTIITGRDLRDQLESVLLPFLLANEEIELQRSQVCLRRECCFQAPFCVLNHDLKGKFCAFSEAKQELTFADNFILEYNNADLKTEHLNEYAHITTKFLER